MAPPPPPPPAGNGGGPSAATAASMAIGVVASSIMLATVVQMGPAYLEPVYGNVLAHQWFGSGVAAGVA
ncbi:hypothetical protein IWW47_003194, partial [Coemansia sp. RSA 2052]